MGVVLLQANTQKTVMHSKLMQTIKMVGFTDVKTVTRLNQINNNSFELLAINIYTSAQTTYGKRS